MIMSDIAKNIKRLRTGRGMNQAKLAEHLNVTRQTISSWERGNSCPDVGMLTQIAQVLEADVHELLYPAANRKRVFTKVEPLSPKFVIWSVVLYAISLIYGGAYIGIPLFRALLGGNMQADYFYFIIWGLILLVGYIAICVGLITEYLADALQPEDTEKQEGQI